MSVTCAICHEDINFCTEEISVLNCGHLYHNGCLQQWLNTNSTCPECRSAVTRNNFVQKLYPSKKEDAESVYRGTSEETKSILKVYEESTKNLQKVFTERIVNLENKNMSLKEDLQKSLDDRQKCSNEINLAEKKILKLTDDVKKSTHENIVLKKRLNVVFKLIVFSLFLFILYVLTE